MVVRYLGTLWGHRHSSFSCVLYIYINYTDCLPLSCVSSRLLSFGLFSAVTVNSAKCKDVTFQCESNFFEFCILGTGIGLCLEHPTSYEDPMGKRRIYIIIIILYPQA